MKGNRCDGCGTDVPVAGGIAGIWGSAQTHTGGLTLEFDDGFSCFLCFTCLNELPDDPTKFDVQSLVGTSR